MNEPEDFSVDGKTALKAELTRALIRRNEYPFEVPLAWWLFLFATIAFTLYESLQSFLSTGRIWPMIFNLAIFLLLGNSYLKVKQRKHWASALGPCVSARN
jgi:hypothetical protein